MKLENGYLKNSASHRKRLAVAVFAAYGWKNYLSDEEILENWLFLNLERSKA